MKNKNKKYKFEKYKPEYKELFKKEKEKLKEVLPGAKIEHVGSTAVPGLGGKGIIDIAIRTPKEELEEYMGNLEGLDYEYKPHPGDEKRKFLQKVLGEGKRRIHIHLTIGKDYWESFIALRNYLRENKEARDKYESIKKEAVEKGKEKENYRKYKEKFIKKLVEKAGKTE